jgi:hypothetical protein
VLLVLNDGKMMGFAAVSVADSTGLVRELRSLPDMPGEKYAFF